MDERVDSQQAKLVGEYIRAITSVKVSPLGGEGSKAPAQFRLSMLGFLGLMIRVVFLES